MPTASLGEVDELPDLVQEQRALMILFLFRRRADPLRREDVEMFMTENRWSPGKAKKAVMYAINHGWLIEEGKAIFLTEEGWKKRGGKLPLSWHGSRSGRAK